MNIATKAPDITPEVAREFQRRATISRMARIEREKAEERQRDIEARALAISRQITPDSDEARRNRVQKQIDHLLTDMESAKSVVVRLRISAALDRLWKLVQPTAGVLRPSKRSQGSTERPTVQPT